MTMSLDSAIAQLEIDVGLLHQVVHGDAATTVTTEGGAVDSLARAGASVLGRLAGTSTTSLAIGTGSKVFATQAGRGWIIGQRLRAASDDGAKAMEGAVTAYGGTSLTIAVDRILGSGTHADWNIAVAGVPGTDGPTPTIAVGTIATGAAGTSVIATLTGTAPNYTLNLTIPQGAAGTNGTGIGDLLASNNLADLANSTTALNNLGGTTVGKAVFRAADAAAARTAMGAAPTDAVTTGANGLMIAADKVKLNGIATGATANSADATLLARANHQGTQAISTVSGLQAALDALAPLASPALTGNPTAPTQAAGNNTTRLATTAFVQQEITSLIGGAPGALNTLAELAAALNDDASYAASVTTNLAGKQPLDATLTAWAGVTFSADKIAYSTGADAFATTTFTSFMRSLLDDADQATARTTLGAAAAATTVTAGTGLTGGGSLAANLSLAIDKATDANLRSAAANKVITADLIESASAPVAITYASSIALDWDAFNVGEVTLTGAVTWANPTNVQPGTTRFVWVKQDATGGRTSSFGANFKGDLPTIRTGASQWTLMQLVAYSTTHIVALAVKGN